MLSRLPLPATRPPAPPRRHQTRHRHLSLLPHPRWSRCHCCRSPPHRAHHYSRSRLTNLLTTCKHFGRKGTKLFSFELVGYQYTCSASTPRRSASRSRSTMANYKTHADSSGRGTSSIGQASPKATGHSRREASFGWLDPAVTLAQDRPKSPRKRSPRRPT